MREVRKLQHIKNDRKTGRDKRVNRTESNAVDQNLHGVFLSQKIPSRQMTQGDSIKR